MFIPVSSNGSTSVCSAIEAANLALPSPTDAFRTANLVMFIIYMAGLYLILTPLLWKYRNHPRFSKVRPFWISMATVFCGSIFCVVSFLRMYIQPLLPCAVVVIGYIITMQGLATVFNLRALVYVVESELQTRLLKKRTAIAEDGEPSHAGSHASAAVVSSIDNISIVQSEHSGSEKFRPPTYSSMKAITRVALGIGKIDEMNPMQLAQVKRPGFLLVFFLVFTSVAWIGIIVLFAAHSSLAICDGCQPYAEVVITAIVISVPDILVLSRICYVGYTKYLGTDYHGVIQEFTLILIFVMPTVVFGMLFEIIDPGQVDTNNVFAWEWLIMISGAFLVLFCGVIQIIFAMNQNRRDRRKGLTKRRRADRQTIVASSGTSLNMLDVILNSSQSNEMGQEFEQVAAKYFVLELVHFLKDVDTFRKYFEEKNDKWRMQKARLLVNMYIRVGAEAEINLSDTSRKRIYEVLDKSPNMSAIRTMFDEAFIEVTRMLEHGAWSRFQETGAFLQLRQGLMDLKRSFCNLH